MAVSDISSVRFKIQIVLCGSLHTISFALSGNKLFLRLNNTFKKYLLNDYKVSVGSIRWLHGVYNLGSIKDW